MGNLNAFGMEDIARELNRRAWADPSLGKRLPIRVCREVMTILFSPYDGVIPDAIVVGNRVRINGFGTWTTEEHGETRRGPIVVKPGIRARFSAGESLKARLAGRAADALPVVDALPLEPVP